LSEHETGKDAEEESMPSKGPELDRLDKLIAAGAGDAAFTPRITIRKDPSGGDRQLWCWHLPQGKEEFHGVVRMVPAATARRDYAAALKARFRLDVDASSIRCDAPTTTQPAVLPLPIQAPLLSIPPEKPAPTSTIIETPSPIESKLEPSPKQLGPPPLTVAELLPLAVKLGPGEELKVRVPAGALMINFQSSLRNTLNGDKLTRAWRWGVRKFYEESGDTEDDIENCLRVLRLSEEELRPSVKSTERVEERVETRVTERSVTLSAPDPTQASHAVISLPAASNKITDSRPAPVRPESYLPADGEAAKIVLDLHEQIAALDDEDCPDGLMDRLWEVQHGVKQYRDAKATVDKILGPWMDDNFAGLFLEEEWTPAWSELWRIVHGAVMQQMQVGEERQKKAVTKMFDRALKAERKLEDFKKQAPSTEQSAFLDLALKFFSEEDTLSEHDWKRINDKELPALAKKLRAEVSA